MPRNSVRDNFSRFQRYATANIKKHLQEVADEMDINVKKIVADKLKETYIQNVEASYEPSSVKGAIAAKNGGELYHHTGKFIESIDTVIEEKRVKIVINGSITYDKPNGGVTATQVYNFLSHGTRATYDPYPYYDKSGKIEWGKNYGMRPHPFEQHTMVQMLGFLNSLESEIKSGKIYNHPEYKKKKRYTAKRR